MLFLHYQQDHGTDTVIVQKQIERFEKILLPPVKKQEIVIETILFFIS